MFDPCAKRSSRRKCFAALEFRRRFANDASSTYAAEPCITASGGDQNPSRIDDRSTPVALKAFALLVFLTYNEAPKSAKRQRSPQFRRTRPRFAARLDVSGQRRAALHVTRAKSLNFHRVSAATVALMRRLHRRKHVRLVQQQHREAEAEIEHGEHEEGVAIAHHHRLAVHDLRQLLHRHQRGVAHA
jgi:hypothetical protein